MPFAPTVLSRGASSVDYLITGAGPAVVLVHGTFADAQGNWAELIDALADRYTVIAPELAGSGATRHPEVVTIDDLAAQVLAAADHAGAERFGLVGHSLGAVTAAAVAARVPGRVNSLVLHAPWPVTGPRGRALFELWDDLLRTDRALLARLLVQTAFAPHIADRWSAAELDETIAGFTAMLDPRHAVQLTADRTADIRDHLPRITAPTLVLGSAQDRIIELEQQRAVAAGITAAEYLEFEAGHALPVEDGPGFVRAVRDHLDRHRGL